MKISHLIQKARFIIFLFLGLILGPEIVLAEPLAVAATGSGSNPADWVIFLGRFHPMLLHLPIGILGAVILMEIVGRKSQFEHLSKSVPFVLLLGSITAVFTAIFGYMLSLEGGYDESTLDWHKWLGIGTAVLAIGLYVLKTKGQKLSQNIYFAGLGAMALFLGIGGHLGGSLTHGSEYLTQYSPFGPGSGSNQVAIEDISQAAVYPEIVQPIIKQKCTSCHNPSKKKGELLLNDEAGFLAGGENGAVFVSGDPENSHLIQRVLLPMEDEEHMPPEGKTPFTDEEIAIVKWWIKNGAPFDKNKKVESMETSEDLMAILSELENDKKGVMAVQVDDADPDDIEALQQNGFRVSPLIEGFPFLKVKASNIEEITSKHIDLLEDVSEQIIELDLSRTKLNDKQLSQFDNFPHLARLRVDNTPITDKGLEGLEKLEYLESLNLFGTKVSDEGLKKLENFSALKNLYLWQTNVSEEGANAFKEKFPEMYVDLGIDTDTTFGRSQLREPTIVADVSLFEGKLEVELASQLPGAEIRYTLDGSEPDHSSQLYQGPLTLSESATLKAIADKEGWKTSNISERDFLKIKYVPKTISLLNPPSENYAGDGAKTLFDLKKGDFQFRSGAWLGYEGEDFQAVVDLGEVKPVERITVSCLEDVGSWIFYPIGVDIWTSVDGKNFKPQGKESFPVTQEQTVPSLKHFSHNFSPVQARYVKVRTRNLTTIPNWHPGAGGKSWVFVDEVLVE